MNNYALNFECFFGVLWPGETEMDIPYIYYFFGDGRELHDDMKQREDVLKLSRFLIGLYDMSNSLFGNTQGPLNAQIFNNSIVVTRIGRYGIVYQYTKSGTLSESSLLNMFHLLCQVFFQDYKNISKEEKKQEKGQNVFPPFPSLSSENIKSQINTLLTKCVTDPMAILAVDSLLPPLFPKDIISPYIYALQQLRAVQVQCPGALLLFTVNGRPLLTTMGPLLTNQILLLSTCNEHLVNHKLTYLFGEYEITKIQSQSQNQHADENNSQVLSSLNEVQISESNEVIEQSSNQPEAQNIHQNDEHLADQSILDKTKVIYINQLSNRQEVSSSQLLVSNNDNIEQECILKLFIITSSPVQIKQSFLSCQLRQLGQKLAIFGTSPALYDQHTTRQQQIQSPFPGFTDITCRDGAKMLKCLAGVENIQISRDKSTFISLQDTYLMGFIMRRTKKWIRVIHSIQIYDKDRFVHESSQAQDHNDSADYVYEESKRAFEHRQRQVKPVGVAIAIHYYKNYDYQDILVSSSVGYYNGGQKTVSEGFQMLEHTIKEFITLPQDKQ